MTKYIISLWVLLTSCSSLPPNAAGSFKAGNESLLKGDYAHAISIYQALERQGVKRSELYCNTGTAFYKLGKLGWAVYYYEKGLAIAPLDSQLVANRRTALANNSAVVESQEATPFLNSTPVLKTADVVAEIAVLGILGCSVLFLAGMFSKRSPNKERLVALSRDALLVSGLLLLLAAGVLFSAQRTEAIIVDSKAIGRMGPSAAARRLFEAKAGDKVELQNHFQGWIKVKMQSGEEGWVTTSSLATLTR